MIAGRVAHITTVDLSLRYLLLNQMLFLQARGFEVIGMSAPGPHVSLLEAHGIRHVPIPFSRKMNPLSDAASLAALYKVLRRENVDIVHTHTPKPGLFGQMAARHARVPVVINTVHGFYFHENSTPFARLAYVTAERIAARYSDMVLFQSGEDMQTARALRLVDAQRMRYLGNGIDLTRFASPVSASRVAEARAQLRISNDSKVVGFVGRLVAEKGVLELAAAMRIIRERVPQAVCLLIGEADGGRDRALNEELARDQPDAFRFAGMRNDVEVLYNLMSVCALPSYREGMPRVLMEAAAAGVPAVATNVRGCREVVEDGVTGLIVEPRTVEPLAAAVSAILEDRVKADAFSMAARARARRLFDERKIFETVASTYDELLAGRAGRRKASLA